MTLVEKFVYMLTMGEINKVNRINEEHLTKIQALRAEVDYYRKRANTEAQLRTVADRESLMLRNQLHVVNKEMSELRAKAKGPDYFRQLYSGPYTSRSKSSRLTISEVEKMSAEFEAQYPRAKVCRYRDVRHSDVKCSRSCCTVGMDYAELEEWWAQAAAKPEPRFYVKRNVGVSCTQYNVHDRKQGGPIAFFGTRRRDGMTTKECAEQYASFLNSLE